MKKKGVMMALGLVMTLTAYGGEDTGTIAAPSSGSETQAKAKVEGETEADTAGQGEREKSRTEASGDAVTLKLSNNQPDGNCTTIVVEWFADQIEERTDGRANIEVYNNGALRDAISCLEQLQYGGMDVAKAGLSAMTNFMDEYNALMTPYIYENTEHFWRVHGEDVGMGILREDKMKEKKLYGLIYYDGGTRCFYNIRKEIYSPKDMKGMLVRIQQSELTMSMVETLGGQSVATACSKVYPALRTGVMDAAESSVANYPDQFHFKVAPYFVEDHHTRSVDILVMSRKSCEKLSAEDLKVIDDTALKSWEYQKELWAEAEEESKWKLSKQDVVITELTGDELKAFQNACEPIWCSYGDGAYRGIINQIVEVGK